MAENANFRVRFAPSPTGYLHIGGARTALYNWLLARQKQGTFILRIEDTDRERSTEASVQAIFDGMRWLGLDWDEGPFFQSQRGELYTAAVDKLLEIGRAYRCYSTPEELEVMREKARAEGRTVAYDGTWRDRDPADWPADQPYVIRYKSPAEGTTVLEDQVKGRVEKDNVDLDDLIILRSDGSPTYNLVVVVDDAEMGISHVIRGDDHLNNTFRQIGLYEALGYTLPAFGHLPMILGEDRKRLSKRHGATNVMSYQELGYLPESVVNFLARIGWSHGDEEIFSVAELVEKFDVEHIGRSAGVWNPTKLDWLNQHWMKQRPAAEIAELLVPFLAAKGLEVTADDARMHAMIGMLLERSKTLVEMANAMAFVWRGPAGVEDYDPKAVKKWLKPGPVEALGDLRAALADIAEADFSAEGVEPAFKRVAEAREMGLGKVCQPVRIAMTGTAVSPGIYEVVEVVGKQETLARIEALLGHSAALLGDRA